LGWGARHVASRRASLTATPFERAEKPARREGIPRGRRRRPRALGAARCWGSPQGLVVPEAFGLLFPLHGEQIPRYAELEAIGANRSLQCSRASAALCLPLSKARSSPRMPTPRLCANPRLCFARSGGRAVGRNQSGAHQRLSSSSAAEGQPAVGGLSRVLLLSQLGHDETGFTRIGERHVHQKRGFLHVEPLLSISPPWHAPPTPAPSA